MLVIQGQVELEMLLPTCKYFLLHATWFPTPAEFIDRAQELQRETKMAVILEDTKRQLKASEELAALGRRQRNIDAGLDPDTLLPIEVLDPILGGLTARMLPAPAERNEASE